MIERLWHWTCDDCGAVEIRKADGLPDGWLWVDERAGTTTHRCASPQCHARIDELAGQGHSGAQKIRRRS